MDALSIIPAAIFPVMEAVHCVVRVDMPFSCIGKIARLSDEKIIQ